MSSQVIPVEMIQMLNDRNKEKRSRAMEAMLQMKKLDVVALRRAFEGKVAVER